MSVCEEEDDTVYICNGYERNIQTLLQSMHKSRQSNNLYYCIDSFSNFKGNDVSPTTSNNNDNNNTPSK